jgi:hypothetical protein
MRGTLSPRMLAENRSHTTAGSLQHDPRDDSMRRERLRYVYRSFDIDDNGSLTPEELFMIGKARREVGQKRTVWNEEKHQKMLGHMGQGAQGDVTEEDFTRYFLSGEGALPRGATEFNVACDEFLEAAAWLRRYKAHNGIWLDQTVTYRGVLKMVLIVLVAVWMAQLPAWNPNRVLV